MYNGIIKFEKIALSRWCIIHEASTYTMCKREF
jgi:hypothetical protein